MRSFSSYGAVNAKLHYHAPRSSLIELVYSRLTGKDSDEGGHYITVWGSRQTGKTWVMQQVLFRLQQDERFDVATIVLQSMGAEQDVRAVTGYIATNLARALNKPMPRPDTLEAFEALFSRETLDKPLVLILDEFDGLSEKVIGDLASVFRNIYIKRQNQSTLPMAEKDYLLHGLALIGVRAALGIENTAGSPFNVQRGLHIPCLTFDEAAGMFQQYQQESGQAIEAEVVERIFYETQGQPGITCWFGELLTETYNKQTAAPITMKNFDHMYLWALYGLPNNNILNLISKAEQEPYKMTVLENFKTDAKTQFSYDDPELNFLYLNGVISIEQTSAGLYVKFPSPFVQKRLFNHFARQLFKTMGKLHEPFEDLSDTIAGERLNVENMLRRYGRHLQKNHKWLLKNAPRRADMRIYEAVYHFSLYKYLTEFLDSRGGEVYPEFPTGNGQIDIIIKYRGEVYGIEVKSYTDKFGYGEALTQAARYGRRMGLAEIVLAFFVERIDDENRSRYEVVYKDEKSGVTVKPVFVEIGI
ncbi:MAG: AAA family ATPase [Gammaproteobacteria bacterium]|nr:AAA family ATPase [Gammaproteobacteria bacterium]